jgi:RNA polymerase sigma-70 factor, ECF subfamily
MPESDLILLEQWTRSRDAEAFRELASKYAGMVYATALRILRNAADAEEVAQECFERLACVGKTPKGHLGAWLHRVATNRAIDRTRSARRRKAREEHYAHERGEAVEITWDDIHEYVDEAIASLPEQYRSPLVAHFLENQSHATVAAALGVSRQTVTYRIGKGVEAIRKSLRKRGIPVAGTALTAMMTARLAEATSIPASLSAAIGRVALAGAKPGLVLAVAGAGAGWLSWKAALVAIVVSVGVVGGFKTLSDTKNEAKIPGQDPLNSAIAAPSPEPSEPEPRTAAAPPPGEADEKEARPAEGNDGVILGRVYDADTEEGIPGVVIRAGSAPSQPTDAEGAYRITGLGTDRFELRRGPIPGYPDQAYRGNPIAVIDSTDSVVTIDFPVRKGVAVAGCVRDMDGRPVKGANVFVESATGGREQDGTTDKDGAFELWGFQGGDGVFVRAWQRSDTKETRSYRWKEYAVGEQGLRGLELMLQPMGSISGKVVNADGQAVKAYVAAALERFLVEPPSPEDLRHSGGGHGGVCDAKGQFKITDLFAGAYQLGFQKTGTQQVVTLAPGEDLKEVLLVLDVAPPEEEAIGSYSIVGRITDSNGTGLERARVKWELENDRFSQGRVSTDKEGRFIIPELVEGLYALSTLKHGYASKERTAVRSGDHNVVFQLHQAGALEGQVLRADTGAPIDAFSVGHHSVEQVAGIRFEENFELGLLKMSRVEQLHHPQGRFRFDKLEPEDHYVVATAPGFAPKVEQVTVGFGEQEAASIEIRLEPEGCIEGRIVDRQGNPVENVLIFTNQLHGKPSYAETLKKLAVHRTGAKGTFEIKGLPSGRITVAAYTPRFLIAETEVTVSAGRTASITLALDGGGVVEGLVSLDERAVGAGHSVYLQGETTQTQSDGTYRFEGVQPHDSAEVRVKLRSGDKIKGGRKETRMLCRDAAIEAGRVTHVDFDFRSMATAYLRGRIQIAGHATKAYKVTLQPFSPRGREGSYSFDFAEQDGSYATGEVSAGSATVCIHCRAAGESRQVSQEIVLKEGPNELNVDFTGRGMLSGKVPALGADGQGALFVHRRNRLTPKKLDQIRQSRRNPGSNAIAHSMLAPDGSFHVEGLDSGEYTALVMVHINHEQSSEAPQASRDWPTGSSPFLAVKEFVLTEGQETRLDLVFE